MKEVDRLSAAVARLGATPEGRTKDGRLLTGADPQSLIEAVLSAIDETVLARELRLRNDRGEEILLEVSGRRLLRVGGVTPSEPDDSRAALIGKPILDANGAASHALFEVLGAMATGATSFAVASGKLSRRPDPAETGCSPESLLASWKRLAARSGPASPPSLADFVARVASRATARLRLEAGKVVEMEGDDEALRHLDRLSQTGLPAPEPSPSGQARRSFVVLTSPTGGRDAILCARDEEEAVLLLFPAGESARLIAAWTRSGSSP